MARTASFIGNFWVPYGYTDLTSLYINEVEYTSFLEFEIIERLNEQSQFKIILVGIDSTAKNNVKRNKIMKMFSSNTLILKGRIERCDYDSNQFATITGNGMELKLKDEYVTRNIDNESIFSAVASTTIVTTTASGVIEVGTNDSLGTMTVRGDYDNKLAIIAGLAEAGGGDWWVSQDTFPFNEDYINVSTRRGNASSVKTFNISGASANMVVANKEEDWDALKNSITILGYGDGNNQLISKIYHATNNRTTLDGDINATATTISLTDASSFPSSGNVWIGCEKVTYAGKSGNDLTSCTRGAAFMGNVKNAYAHKSGIAVWDAQYTETSAETDSMIGDGSDSNNANYGLRRGVFSYPDVLDQNTLDFLAQNTLADHQDLVKRITLVPIIPRDILETVSVGDEITITDADADLSGDYKVVGKIFRCKEGYETLELEVSNAKHRFVGSIEQSSKEGQKNIRYMQGSTQFYNLSKTDNLDDAKDLDMRFYLPADVIRINEAKLSFSIQKFRAYTDATQTSQTGLAHGHGLSGVTTDTTAVKSSAGVNTDTNASSITLSCPTITGGTHTMVYVIVGDVVGADTQLKIRVLSDSNLRFEQENTFDSLDPNTTYFCDGWYFDTYDGGNTLTLEVKDMDDSAYTCDYLAIYARTYKLDHTHSFTGETTDTEQGHYHDITMSYGIYEGSTPSANIVVTAGLEASEAAVGTYNSDQANLDITSNLRDAYATNRAGWYNIKFDGAENVRVDANAWIRFFVKDE